MRSGRRRGDARSFEGGSARGATRSFSPPGRVTFDGTRTRGRTFMVAPVFVRPVHVSPDELPPVLVVFRVGRVFEASAWAAPMMGQRRFTPGSEEFSRISFPSTPTPCDVHPRHVVFYLPSYHCPRR
jgi:hypothetical protein